MGCLCLSVIQWVSARCLARFSLGGTDSIHSPDNRPAIHSRGWEKLSSEQGRGRKSAKKKKRKECCRGCVQYSVQLTGTCTRHSAKGTKKTSRAGENKRKHWMEMRAFQQKRDFLVVFRKNMQIVGYKKPGWSKSQKQKGIFLLHLGVSSYGDGFFLNLT